MSALRRRYAALQDRYNARVAADEAQQETDDAVDYVLSDFADQLDRVKTVAAHHIIASGDTALREQLEAAGVCIEPYLILAEARKAVRS